MRQKLTKAQIKERDLILFGKEKDWKAEGNDIIRFSGLSVAQLRKLVEKGYADPDDAQNDSPSIKDFLEFMTKHSAVFAHGYVVSATRDDVRVSLEGLGCAAEFVTPALKDDFIELCHDADEFHFRMDLYAWWD
jgi:hypothetical protein